MRRQISRDVDGMAGETRTATMRSTSRALPNTASTAGPGSAFHGSAVSSSALVSRISRQVASSPRRGRPEFHASTASDSRLAGVAASVLPDAVGAWNSGLPHLGLEATWRLIRETNAELETAEPWKADPGPAVDAVLGSALEVLRIVAVLVSPAMPSTSREIWRRIGLSGAPANERLPGAAAWGGYPGGLPVEKGAPLFPRRKD